MVEGLLSTGLPCLVWKETLHYEYCVTILRLLNAYILEKEVLRNIFQIERVTMCEHIEGILNTSFNMN